MDLKDERGVPNTPGGILAAVRALGPELRSRSAEIEQERELPADIVEMMRAAGVFRMGFGREFGGPGLTSSEQTEVVAALAYGDAAAGWCGMIGMDSGLYTLRHEVVRELFPSLDMIAAGMLLPAGRAERVPGGYRLSGRWGFASGILHADWVASGAFIQSNHEPELVDGRPRTRILMTRPEQVKLQDNWHATGLAGSGSVDYTISDVFVPEEHTFSLAEPAGRSGALAASDAPMRKMPGVALGVARAALDHVREIAQTRTSPRRDTGTSWSDSYRVQVVLGECEMEYLAMYHGVHGSLVERWDTLEAGATFDDLTPDERIATMLTRLHAMQGARAIVRRLYDLVATSAIYATSPLDRWLRDLETMCQHVMAQEKIAQSAGAYLLGGTPEFPLALGVTS